LEIQDESGSFRKSRRILRDFPMSRDISTISRDIFCFFEKRKE